MSLARSCEETLIHPLFGVSNVQLQGVSIVEAEEDEGVRGVVCERGGLKEAGAALNILSTNAFAQRKKSLVCPGI